MQLLMLKEDGVMRSENCVLYFIHESKLYLIIKKVKQIQVSGFVLVEYQTLFHIIIYNLFFD